MAEHPNVTRTREYLDTFARGDLQGLRPFFSDDVVWHVAGSHDLSGDYVRQGRTDRVLRDGAASAPAAR